MIKIAYTGHIDWLGKPILTVFTVDEWILDKVGNAVSETDAAATNYQKWINY